MSEVTVSVKMPMETVVGNKGYEEIIWAGRSGPVMFKKALYEEWPKHYAKDARARYRGTVEPGVDFLLMDEDEERWRGGAGR